MLLAVLVIGRRAFLERLAQRFGAQRLALIGQREGLLGKVQHVAPIAIGHVDKGFAGAGLEREFAALKVFGPYQQFFQRVWPKPFQRQDRASRQKRPIDLEARVFSRRANEGHHARLYERQKTVLLGAVEPVDLIHKQQRALARIAPVLGPVEGGAKIFDPREDSADRFKLEIGFLGQQAGNRRLADTGRAPEDDRAKPARLQHPPERAIRAEQMVLPHHLRQLCGAQAVGQRPRRVVFHA